MRALLASVLAGVALGGLAAALPAGALFSGEAPAQLNTLTAGTLNPPTGVSARAAVIRTVPVSWTASAAGGTAIAPQGYYVTRTDTSTLNTSPACGTSGSSLTTATSCVDGGVADGTYSYAVTAVYNGWTATATAPATVTVLGPTKLASASGLWCDPATWSPNGVPTASDTVGINGAGTTITITGTCAAVAQKVTLGDISPTSDTLTFAAAGATLTTGGSVQVTQPDGAATRNVQVNAGALSVGGDLALAGGAVGDSSSEVAQVTITSGTTAVGGNLVFNAANRATPSASSSRLSMSGGVGTFQLAGAFVLNGTTPAGTLTPGTTSSFDFDGTSAQTVPIGVSNVVYDNLLLDNTSAAGATLGGAITTANVTGNLQVQTGTLDNGGFAIAGNTGKTFSVGVGATFDLSGTASAFPTGFGISLDRTSTVNYDGTAAQTVAAQSYGNLGSSNTGSRTLASAGTIGIFGAFSPGTDSYAVTGSTVDFDGNAAQTVPPLSYFNLTISNTRLSAANVTIGSGLVGIAGAFNPVALFNGGGYVDTGSTLNFNGSGQSVPQFNYYNLALNPTGGLTTLLGTTGVAGTFSAASGSYSVTTNTFNYDGTAAQTVAAFNYNNLTISTGGAVTLASSGTIGLAGSFTPSSSGPYTVTGSTVNYNGTGSQTITAFQYFNLTSSSFGARTLADSGVIAIAGTFTPSTNSYTSAGSTIDFDSAGSQTVPAFGSYNNLTIDSGGAVTLAPGTIGIAGAFTPNAAGPYASLSDTVNYNGTGAQTVTGFNYNNLTISGTRTTSSVTLDPSRVIAVAGVLSPTATFTTGVYVNTGSTVSFNGTQTQTITVGSGGLNYNNLSADNTGVAAVLGAAVTPTNVVGNLTVGHGTLDNGGFAVAGNAGATFHVAASATFKLSGTSSGFPSGFGTTALDPASTVNYAGSGAQTIVAVGYGNLTSSSSGARTLAGSGTIGIAGAFTPGTNSYTNAGSTIDFDSAGSQTIAVFNYNNLSIDSGGVATLAPGTIGVAGAFTPNAAGPYTTIGNIFSYNGAGTQTVSAFPYYDLSISGNRGGATVTLAAGTIGIASADLQAFNPSATNVTYSTAGNTFDYNGTGGQTVTGFNYDNLTISGAHGSSTIVFASLGGTVGVAGTFNPSATFTTGGYNVSARTIDFNGTGAQTVPVFTYGNLSISGARGTSSVTLDNSGTIKITGSFTPTATFSGGGYLTTGSTVEFIGCCTGQTVPAFQYDNLTVASDGGANVVLAGAGTIKIAGAFTVGSGNPFTSTGSTVDFDGTGSQTVPKFGNGYNNLTISGARGASTVTLAASGTIGIGGVFNPSATFTTGDYSVTGSTVQFFSGSQTVPAFNYYNLQLLSGADTLDTSGPIGVAGTLSGNFTSAGSTVIFNGSGAQTIPVGNYNNLTISGDRGDATVSVSTIGVAGTFTTAATNVTYAALGGTTVTYNGPDGQTIAAFPYSSLSSTNSNRVLASTGTIGITGGFTPGTGAYTVTGSTVDYDGIAGNQTITNTFAYNNLTISGAGQKSLNGNTTVLGSFTNNFGVLSTGTAAVIFAGSGTQTIGGTSPTTFWGLTVSKPSGNVVLTQDTTASGTLALTAGVIATGSHTVIANGGVTRGTGFVDGNLRKPIPGNNSSPTFEVGSGTYAPITLAITGASSNGTLTASTTGAQHPSYGSSGLGPAQYVARYWTLSAGGGLTVAGYNATFTFAAGDLVGSPDTSNLAVRRFAGSWSAPASSASTGTTVSGTGFGTAFGDYATGVPPTVAGLSPTSGSAGQTGVTINASGFAASQALTVTVGGTAAAITSGGVTGANGTSTVTFTIPSLAAGTYHVVVSDGTLSAQSAVDFTVH